MTKLDGLLKQKPLLERQIQAAKKSEPTQALKTAKEHCKTQGFNADTPKGAMTEG